MKHLTSLSLAMVIVMLMACSKHGNNDNYSDNQQDKIAYIFKGSDTELEMIKTLADNFFAENPNSKKIKILGGGSAIGIQSLINDDIQAANSSRKMTKKEINQAIDNGVDPIQAIIAIDAIAIITNNRLGVDSLSTVQVANIYKGNIKNWKEVGGPDRAIKLYGRNHTSGTYDYMKNNILKDSYSSDMQQMSNTTSIIDAVKTDPQGVGYVGVGYLINKEGKPTNDVWATYIYIDGDRAYSPYELKSVEKGLYPITRPLYQYFNGAPSGSVMNFLQFELSGKGQQLIRNYGYFPINSFHRQINMDNGIVGAYNRESIASRNVYE